MKLSRIISLILGYVSINFGADLLRIDKVMAIFLFFKSCNPDNPGGIWSVSALDDTRQMDFTLEESSWMTDKSRQNLT